MKKILLSGKWRMRGNGYDCEGTIPGSLFSFLLSNSLIEDPYYRDNEFSALELTRHNYSFEREFLWEGGNDKYFLGANSKCSSHIMLITV